MKQTLLTAVVLAASSAYVAFANGDLRARLERDIGIGAAGRPVDTIASSGPAVAPTTPAASPAEAAAPMATAPTPAPPPDMVGADYDRLVGLGLLAYRSGDQHDDDEDENDDDHDHVEGGAVTSLVSPPAEPRAGDRSSTALAATLPRPRPSDAPKASVSPAPAAEPDAGPLVPAAPQAAQANLKNGTFRGPSEGAYYGRVQVAAVITGGKLTKIEILDYPSDRRRSQRISQFALPALEQEAVSAQSADIDIVSGATLTSEAFVRSLDAALAKARS